MAKSIYFNKEFKSPKDIRKTIKYYKSLTPRERAYIANRVVVSKNIEDEEDEIETNGAKEAAKKLCEKNPNLSIEELSYIRNFDDLDLWLMRAQKIIDSEAGKPKKETTTVTSQKQKKPPKEAFQAYQILKKTGYNQAEVAKIMTDELGDKVEQYQVSRWKTQCDNWFKECGIGVVSNIELTNKISINPAILDMGARTDGRTTGDPRHRADPDSDVDE